MTDNNIIIDETKSRLDRMTNIVNKMINELIEYVDEEELPTIFKERIRLTEEEIEMFDIWDLVYPKMFKIVEVTLCREQRATIKVVMPEDADKFDVMDYINGSLDDIDLDDDGKWDVDFVDIYADNLMKDDVIERYKNQLWNYDNINDM